LGVGRTPNALDDQLKHFLKRGAHFRARGSGQFADHLKCGEVEKVRLGRPGPDGEHHGAGRADVDHRGGCLAARLHPGGLAEHENGERFVGNFDLRPAAAAGGAIPVGHETPYSIVLARASTESVSHPAQVPAVEIRVWLPWVSCSSIGGVNRLGSWQTWTIALQLNALKIWFPAGIQVKSISIRRASSLNA